MSWLDFQRLIDQQNADITAWMAAIEANPNTPEDALKTALLEILQRRDLPALERLAALILDLVRNADSMLDALIELEEMALDASETVVVTGLDAPWDAPTAPAELPW